MLAHTQTTQTVQTEQTVDRSPKVVEDLPEQSFGTTPNFGQKIGVPPNDNDEVGPKHSFSKIAVHSPTNFPIQTKLKINSPGDKYEIEADRIAEQVMRMPAPQIQQGNRKTREEGKIQRKPIAGQISPIIQRMPAGVEEEEEVLQTKLIPGIQRKCAKCEDEEALQRKPIAGQISLIIQRMPASMEEEEEVLQTKLIPNIQRKCAKCEEEEEQTVQTKSAGNNTPVASPSLSSRIQNTRGRGQAMDANTNAFMSTRFGTDFSGVRIHANSSAAQMSQEINAQAFTVGRDVYFNHGKYNPCSTEGKQLLAHELVHVVQQSTESKDNILFNHDETFPNLIKSSSILSKVKKRMPFLIARQVKRSVGKSAITTLSPEEMLEKILHQRGFVGGMNKDGMLGHGTETHAMAQLLDRNGNAVAHELGGHIRGKSVEIEARKIVPKIKGEKGKVHAERMAVEGLKRRIKSGDLKGLKVRDYTLQIVVDQKPCPPNNKNCIGVLKKFADEFVLNLEVWVPTRPNLRAPAKSASSKTSARTAFKHQGKLRPGKGISGSGAGTGSAKIKRHVFYRGRSGPTGRSSRLGSRGKAGFSGRPSRFGPRRRAGLRSAGRPRSRLGNRGGSGTTGRAPRLGDRRRPGLGGRPNRLGGRQRKPHHRPRKSPRPSVRPGKLGQLRPKPKLKFRIGSLKPQMVNLIKWILIDIALDLTIQIVANEAGKRMDLSGEKGGVRLVHIHEKIATDGLAARKDEIERSLIEITKGHDEFIMKRAIFNQSSFALIRYLILETPDHPFAPYHFAFKGVKFSPRPLDDVKKIEGLDVGGYDADAYEYVFAVPVRVSEEQLNAFIEAEALKLISSDPAAKKLSGPSKLPKQLVEQLQKRLALLNDESMSEMSFSSESAEQLNEEKQLLQQLIEGLQPQVKHMDRLEKAKRHKAWLKRKAALEAQQSSKPVRAPSSLLSPSAKDDVSDIELLPGATPSSHVIAEEKATRARATAENLLAGAKAMLKSGSNQEGRKRFVVNVDLWHKIVEAWLKSYWSQELEEIRARFGSELNEMRSRLS